MMFAKSLKTLAAAVALTAIAGMASAATKYALVSTNDTFEYNGATSTASLSGTAYGKLIGDTAPSRDYTLHYWFEATLTGVNGNPYSSATRTTGGSYALPGSFSLDDTMMWLGALPASGGAFSFFSDEALNYSNLLVGSNTATVDYNLTLGEDSLGSLLGQLGLGTISAGFNGTATGKFVAHVWLMAEDVAPVPLPAAAPLLVFGIAGLVAFGRKRRKTA